MAEIAGAIGVVSGLMGIWQFVAEQLPAAESPSSNYRVTTGLNGYPKNSEPKLDNAQGQIELIKVYNVNHELIGSGSGGTVSAEDDNQYTDMAAEQQGNSQSIWTEFFAGNDAICIATITATMDEGSQWGWTGDWGFFCGMPWFPSGYEMKNSNGVEHASPRCTWLDKDHTNDLKVGVIGINWSDLAASDKELSQADAEKHCGSSMQAWPNDGGEQMLPMTKKKRYILTRRSQRSDNRLVISALATHNATEVCESETSWGPDFVSEAEGVYCNMATHEAVPLCDGGLSEDCFDVNGAGGPAMRRRNGKRDNRKFSSVVKWGH